MSHLPLWVVNNIKVLHCAEEWTEETKSLAAGCCFIHPVWRCNRCSGSLRKANEAGNVTLWFSLKSVEKLLEKKPVKDKIIPLDKLSSFCPPPEGTENSPDMWSFVTAVALINKASKWIKSAKYLIGKNTASPLSLSAYHLTKEWKVEHGSNTGILVPTSSSLLHALLWFPQRDLWENTGLLRVG